MANDLMTTPLKVVTGDGLAYYHEKVKLLTKDARGRELTQAEYDALSEEEKLDGTTYFIRDASEIPLTATSVMYNGTNVGTALDLVNAELTSLKTDDGVVKSSNADYAEVAMWSDENPDNEDRIGYFVTVSKTEAGITMTKANSTSDVRGVTVLTPAFAAGASSDKYDSTGKLVSKYSYVAFAGFVKVYDNGSCTIGERCMCDDNGCAIPSTNNMGYEVIDRIDSTSILILVEPSGDMLQKIREDVGTLETTVGIITPIKLTQAEYDALPDTKLTDGKTYYIIDGNDTLSAEDLYYDNSHSELTSQNAQAAIDEVNMKAESKLDVSLKGSNGGLAELDSNGKVPNSQLPSFADVLAVHANNTSIHVTSDEKNAWNNKGSYSKPSGGIPRTDLATDITDTLNKADNDIPIVKLTNAEYDALPDTKLTDGKIYCITDDDGDTYVKAEKVGYNNSSSTLSGQSMQTAIDEVDYKIELLKKQISDLQSRVAYIDQSN